MKYARFEDLPVWKSAIELADGVYRLTRNRFFSQPGDLHSQLRRAALSVSNNIAEGFERGTTAELLAFLYIARGSAGEVRSMLHFVERMLVSSSIEGKHGASTSAENLKSEISDFKSEISNLRSLAESCSRQIRGWADSLQSSAIAGQRHLNDQSRAAYDQNSRAEAFWNKLEVDHQRRLEAWAEAREAPV